MCGEERVYIYIYTFLFIHMDRSTEHAQKHRLSRLRTAKQMWLNRMRCGPGERGHTGFGQLLEQHRTTLENAVRLSRGWRGATD